MTTKELRSAVRKTITDYNAAVAAQRTVTLELEMLLFKAEESVQPVRLAKAENHPYRPETWTDEQRACHKASSLEEAFHQASCLSGGWYHRAVVIWCAVVGQDELYWILPEDAPKPTDADYHRSYRVERCPDE